MGPVVTVMPQLIEALHALWADALAAFEHEGEQVPVGVYDGPSTSGETFRAELLVGVDDPDDPDGLDAGSSQVQWGALGALARDDRGAIVCAAVGWSGDASGPTAMRDTRRLAMAVVEAASASLLAATSGPGSSPWLGVPGAVYGHIGDLRLRQGLTSNQEGAVAGVVVHVIFTVNYRARV